MPRIGVHRPPADIKVPRRATSRPLRGNGTPAVAGETTSAIMQTAPEVAVRAPERPVAPHRPARRALGKRCAPQIAEFDFSQSKLSRPTHNTTSIMLKLVVLASAAALGAASWLSAVHAAKLLRSVRFHGDAIDKALHGSGGQSECCTRNGGSYHSNFTSLFDSGEGASRGQGRRQGAIVGRRLRARSFSPELRAVSTPFLGPAESRWLAQRDAADEPVTQTLPFRLLCLSAPPVTPCPRSAAEHPDVPPEPPRPPCSTARVQACSPSSASSARTRRAPATSRPSAPPTASRTPTAAGSCGPTRTRPRATRSSLRRCGARRSR
jgi:hypothetical protein